MLIMKSHLVLIRENILSLNTNKSNILYNILQVQNLNRHVAATNGHAHTASHTTHTQLPAYSTAIGLYTTTNTAGTTTDVGNTYISSR